MHRSIERVARDWADHPYFAQAEEGEYTERAWNGALPFRPLFDTMDPTHLVELACGRGRHLPFYRDLCQTITMLDVNETNVSACRERWGDDTRIRFGVCDGASFTGVADASTTAVFSYDSMVHFDVRAVIGYLDDAVRILVPGGRILLHHSNYAGNPGGYYGQNPHGRNYMTQDLFRHLAETAGLRVLDSRLMDWGGGRTLFRNTDAVTLMEKPAA